MPTVSMTVNGKAASADVEARTLLVQYLREHLGLTGTPYNSGNSRHEQGISKAGNGRARAVAVQLAWLWRRHQPHSALSRWFEERVGRQNGAGKRIAIVALARKLLIALWHLVRDGVVPEGVVLRPAH